MQGKGFDSRPVYDPRMRLSELSRAPGLPDVASRVLAQLNAAGLVDVAAYAVAGDADDLTVYIATDVGIYVGEYAARREFDGHRTVTGTVIPWSEVRGAGIAFSGFPSSGEGPIITVTIDHPEFSASERPAFESQKALADFARECMKRQGRPSQA